MLVHIIILSSVTAFLILLITKIGLRGYAQMKGTKRISKLFGCDFCLSFWGNLIASIILFLFVKDIEILLYSLVTTPLTRLLL